MVAEFADEGIRFKYPENWRLEREDSDNGWTISVQSPKTAFWMICYRDDAPTPESMAEGVLAAMREEYPDIDVDDFIDSLAGEPTVGHEMHFFSLDLTNTCWTRSIYSARGTLLVMCQTNDLEWDENEPVLRAMCASLELEEE